MDRILMRLLPLVVVGMGSALWRAGQAPAGGDPGLPAAAPRAAAGMRGQMTEWLLQAMGAGKLAPGEMSLVTTVIAVYCAVFGIATNFALGERGFGQWLNGIVGFAGACIGLVLYARIFAQFSPAHLEIVALVVVFFSSALLLACIVLKIWVMEEADSFMTGGRASAAARSPKGAAASRLDAIANRRRD